MPLGSWRMSRRPDQERSDTNIGCWCLGTVGVLTLLAILGVVFHFLLTWHGLP